MEEIAKRLRDEGYDITSRWVYGEEEGKTNEDIAIFDIDDLDDADTVISFTQPYGTMYKGGGRNVEFGYGYAENKRMILIGERENVFHWLPSVEQFNTIEDFLTYEQTTP